MVKKIFILVMLVGDFVSANGLNAINDPVMNPCIQRPNLAGCSGNNQLGGKCVVSSIFPIVGGLFILIPSIVRWVIQKIIPKVKDLPVERHWQVVSKPVVVKIRLLVMVKAVE